MRNLAFVLLGFLLLVQQAAIGVMVPLDEWAPNLLLPIVIYLGVAHDVHIVRGVSLAFVLGYLLDSFCGSPMGLQTFVMVATFLVARGAGLNLFMRGPLFQIALTFVFGVLAGGSILALRAIFEPPAPFPTGTVSDTVIALTAGAAITALLSPLVFLTVRRLDALVTRRREEAAAT
ncbi:MAG: rod shape-determining protein MreD [Sandaracinaceae bacterium]|nr:MAG: rod shape-determining protein MreD [Sandaracinaceae bacterium]HBQ14213.1 rod shape-determining protein MreD [Myxococcales bacterium]